MSTPRARRGGPSRLLGAALAGLIASALLCARPASGLRLPAEQERGQRVRVHTFWNPQYLLLAARVPDPMITATNAAPMSAPEQDDAIEFSFEIPTAAGPSAHRLIISAAGGMTVYTRDARGAWRADPSWVSGPRTIRYSVAVDGTLNDPRDRDVGYVVECAIPWEFLGGEAPVGKEIGFNIVVWLQGESTGVASWSPLVQDPAQVGDTARWGRLLIGPGSGMGRPVDAWAPSPFVPVTPFVDGKLGADEWLTATVIEIAKPEPTIEVSIEPTDMTGVAGTVMAVYRYDWQGGAEAPDGAPLWAADGAPATSHQPIAGAGPWVSYRRVDWHSDQLAEVQRAGVDVVLARYSGEEAARRSWARIGLARMVQALKGRRSEGMGYPLVGMMLDTEALRGVDLTSEEGRELLWGMVREFFLQVPSEFRAQIGAQPERKIAGGVPILLGEPEGIAGWDAGTFAYCEDRFTQDFGGARIAWLGSAAWRAEGVEFDSFIALATQSGFTVSAPGGRQAVSISPGSSPAPGATGEVRPRLGGAAYRTDWQRALASKPEMVIINSWNDFAAGTEIAPSRQHGVIYVDATRYLQSRLGSQEPHHLALKQHRLPEVVAPGVEALGELLVENVGTEELRTGRRVSVDIELRRASDGAVVRTVAGAQGLAIAAGQTQRLPVVVSARDDRGNPLPPGDYLFALKVTRSRVAYLRSRWSTRGIAELTAPFRVGQPPARRATVISTSLPSGIESGGVEAVVVRLRNDGAAVWRPGQTQLSYHWLTYRDDLCLSTEQAVDLVAKGGARADMPREIRPGEVVSVLIPVRAANREGEPLPPPAPGDLWHYRLQWDLADGVDGWFSAGDRPAGEEAVHVVSADAGAVFESVEVPVEVSAGNAAEVQVVVANAGSLAWRALDSMVLYSWYRWDGRQTGWGGTVPLPEDVPPGGKALVASALTTPDMPGPYWVVWQLAANGKAPFAEGEGRRRDLVVTPVFARSPRVRSVDLSAHANALGITTDTYRARGDFDGRGNSLPAEWLPPDQTGPREHLYPSGYYAPGAPKSAIPFSFPSASSGAGGVVACTGQTISLGDGGARTVHLAVASIAGEREATFELVSASGEREPVTVTVPSWLRRPEGSAVACYAPYMRTLAGDDAGRPVYLAHLSIASESGGATSLALPRDPAVRVVAVTVEGE